MDSEDNTDLRKIMQEFIDNTMHISMSNYFQFGRNYNLSFSQLIILHRLHKGGPCLVSEISKMLDISNSAVSQLLEKLVQLNFVSRYEKPEDRRKKYHAITEQGMDVVKKSREARVSWIDSLEKNITPDESEIVTEALTIMVSKIKELGPVHHHHKQEKDNC